jgi:hypothetical protein
VDVQPWDIQAMKVPNPTKMFRLVFDGDIQAIYKKQSMFI